MMNPKLLRSLAVYGVSLPTFAASPAVAKATVFMPSHIAVRMLGGRSVAPTGEQPVDASQSQPSDGSSSAA